MRWSIVLTIAAAATQAGCVSNPTGVVTTPTVSIEMTRITPSAPEPLYYSGLSESTRLVITDQATLAEVWNRVFATMTDPPAIPAVDFAHERVLVAALGARTSGGYRIEFDHATAESEDVVAEVRTSSPGAHCATSLAITQPVDIVKIPLSGGPIRFAEIQTITDCSH